MVEEEEGSREGAETTSLDEEQPLPPHPLIPSIPHLDHVLERVLFFFFTVCSVLSGTRRRAGEDAAGRTNHPNIPISGTAD